MFRRIVACLLATLPLAACQFSQPKADAVLTAGDKINVTYETDWKNYTVALWQRDGNKTGTKLGSVVFETTNGPSSSFSWTVQTYDLDLKASGTFFFWLFLGNSSQQGTSAHQISSSTFTIVDGASKTPTATFVASTNPSNSPPPSSADGSSSSDSSLSTGAKAGIGVGVSLFCLLAMALLFLFLRYRSRKREEIDALRENSRGAHTEYSNSVAELQSECVSPTPFQKPPAYLPVPGDNDSLPSIAELEA